MNETRGGGLAGVLGGDQVLAPIDACHILDDNSLLNGNNVALLGGSIQNGDSTGGGLLSAGFGRSHCSERVIAARSSPSSADDLR